MEEVFSDVALNFKPNFDQDQKGLFLADLKRLSKVKLFH